MPEPATAKILLDLVPRFVVQEVQATQFRSSLRKSKPDFYGSTRARGAPGCAAAEAAAHLAHRYAGATSGVSGRRLVRVAAKAAPATSRIAPVPMAAASAHDSAAPPPAADPTLPVPPAPASVAIASPPPARGTQPVPPAPPPAPAPPSV